MNLLWSFVRRDAICAASYRTAFVLPWLYVAVQVPMLYLLAKVVSGDTALGGYQGQYFAFVLLGFAFHDYAALSLSSFLNGIRDHQLMGTLEIVMLSPTPMPVILLCSSLWGYLFTSIRFALFVLTGLCFGLDLSQADLLSFALLVPAAVASFAALGILGAAGALVIKQGSSITAFLATTMIAFGGVAYPVELLPGPLQRLAQLLPFTHALSGLRRSLLLGAGPHELAGEIGALFGFAVLLFPAGLFAFSLALRHAKRAGTLAQY